MLRWLSPGPAESRLLPGGRLHGPTAYIIAIMTFAMLLIAAAGLALANGARLVSAGSEHRYSLQVPGAGQNLERIAGLVRSTPGVERVETVPAAEMQKSLERWLGPAARDQDLPVPALVDFDLAPGTDEAMVSRRLETAAPSARVIAHRSTVGPLLASLWALQWVALAIVLLMAAATCAAVVLAARGALDTHRSTIEVMHGIGATDLQIANLFQRKVALDALAGGLSGAALAALVLVFLGTGGAALAGDVAGTPALRGIDLVLLLLVPLAIVLLATGVARLAVVAALRRSL